MAANTWTVYVPDRSSAYPFPKSMDVEEIRQSLVTTGVASVASANVTLESGDVVRFSRVQGGSKGL